MKESIENLYIQKIQQYSEALKKVERKIKLISTSRLIIAIGIIVSFYFGLTYSLSLFYLFFILIFLFSALILIHSTQFKKKNLLINFVRINTEELNALNGKNDAFDNGSEFTDHQHPYSYDLDIFGKGSLFESLCRTVTYRGKSKLAQSISQIPNNESEILSRQNSAKELKNKLEFRQNFRARGLMLNETIFDRQQMSSWLNDELHFIGNKFLQYYIIILPFISLPSAIYGLYTGKWNPVIIAVLLINSLIYSLNSKKINALFLKISRKKYILENYSELMGLAEHEQFNSEELKAYHDNLKDGSKQFKKLSDYTGWFDQRLNVLFSPIANILLLFDLHCCFLIEKWKSKNDKKINEWLDALGEIDLRCSLANMAYNNPDFIFSEIVNDKPFIDGKDVAHPLLINTKRVVNNFEIGIKERIAIITGANMAGKSTFLRTIGTNLILAYAGAPVCASSFRISLMNIYSSMRISDSLKDHASYFYAELQRLKLIKESLVNGARCLILLDEMLKGTNSNDKQEGSKAFVKSLLQYNCLSMVATHDLELGKLEVEHAGQIKNYSFESFLSKNHLTFDYKIREGTAKNTNASFLMRDMGII